MTNELNRPAARVYYTGDVANRDGWFTVAPTPNAREVRLVEEPGERSEGRVITVFPSHIGDVYAGHCNPRFVDVILSICARVADGVRAAKLETPRLAVESAVESDGAPLVLRSRQLRDVALLDLLDLEVRKRAKELAGLRGGLGIATATMSRDDLLALRDAINAEIGEKFEAKLDVAIGAYNIVSMDVKRTGIAADREAMASALRAAGVEGA